MRIRKYDARDESDVISLWNESLFADRITPEIFRERILLDPNFDKSGFLLAEDNKGIVGATIGFIRRTDLPWGYERNKDSDSGYIIVFFVAPDYYQTEIEKKLLENVILYFKKLGKKNISFSGYSPTFFPSGIDPEIYPHLFDFFKQNGFTEVGVSYSMRKDIFSFQIPEKIKKLEKKLKQEGITFSYFKLQYLLGVKEFLSSEFPHWLHKFVDKILLGHPNDEIVIVLKEEKVIGYCQHNYYRHLERVGPFGISSAFRGRKIGTVMLCKLLEGMAKKGYHYAWLGSTDLAKNYYERMGFEVFRKNVILKKEI